jgi:uncharacterized protein (DUF1810 family)
MVQMPDPFDLDRFIQAQEPLYPRVIEELRRGRKTTHWMWFIFPQLKGLGRSPTADRYGIASLEEAKSYLQHPTLGARLIECTSLVKGIVGRSAAEIFGGIDCAKFRSSMTLFAEATARDQVFREAITKYFQGEPDGRTLEMLQALGAGHT